MAGGRSPELEKLRNTPAVQQQLRQFMKLETGLGNSPEFQRGYTFAFEFTEERKAEVNHLMEVGMTFEEAFDAVWGRIKAEEAK